MSSWRDSYAISNYRCIPERIYRLWFREYREYCWNFSK